MRRVLLAAAAFGVAVGVSTPAAMADPAPQITICHGTASATNPYAEITVSASSFKDGHFDGYPNPSHGPNNNPDFIPAPGATCDQGPGGGGGG